MSAVHVAADDKLKFDVRAPDGTIIKPGDHKGSPDDALLVEVRMSTTERALNDCLEDVSGLVRGGCAMLGIDLGMPLMTGKRAFPKQTDVDTTVDNAVKLIKYQTEKYLRLANNVNERDPVLRDGRRLLHDLVVRLRTIKVSPTTDTTPALILAARWMVCSWLLTNARSNDADKVKAIGDWRDALDEFARLTR